MRRFFLAILLVLPGFCLTAQAFGAASYRTSCRIDGTQARAYIRLLTPQSIPLSGRGYVTSYDSDGRILGKTPITLSGNLAQTSTPFLLGSSSVRMNTAACGLDVTEALGASADGFQSVDYITSCRIDAGIARGMVRLVSGSGSRQFNGRVWYQLYNEVGSCVDRQVVNGSGTVSGREWVSVGRLAVNAGIKYCDFDVWEAASF